MDVSLDGYISRTILGHCDDLCPRFLKKSCLEKVANKFGVWIPLGMAECCILFWLTLAWTLTSDLICSFFLYSGLYV